MMEQLRDIKGVIYVFDWGTLLFFLILGLFLGLGLFYLYKHIRRRAAEKGKRKVAVRVPARPFNELALEGLGKISPVEYFEKKKIKEFYFEITEIVRQFLANNYHIDTMDRTSLEIIEELERVERDFIKIKKLDRYFKECDMVKFAKLRPGLAELKQKKTESENIIKEYFRRS